MFPRVCAIILTKRNEDDVRSLAFICRSVATDVIPLEFHHCFS